MSTRSGGVEGVEAVRVGSLARGRGWIEPSESLKIAHLRLALHCIMKGSLHGDLCEDMRMRCIS